MSNVVSFPGIADALQSNTDDVAFQRAVADRVILTPDGRYIQPQDVQMAFWEVARELHDHLIHEILMKEANDYVARHLLFTVLRSKVEVIGVVMVPFAEPNVLTLPAAELMEAVDILASAGFHQVVVTTTSKFDNPEVEVTWTAENAAALDQVVGENWCSISTDHTEEWKRTLAYEEIPGWLQLRKFLADARMG